MHQHFSWAIKVRYDTHIRQGKQRHHATHSGQSTRPILLIEALEQLEALVPGGIGFRTGCRKGLCGTCGCMINGIPKLACQHILNHENPVAKIEALPYFPIEYGLKVLQLATNQPSFQLDRSSASSNPLPPCIGCGLCKAVCPNNPAGGTQPQYHPGLSGLRYRYWRAQVVQNGLIPFPHDEAVWNCGAAGMCTTVCPMNLPVATYIQQAKLSAALTQLIDLTDWAQGFQYLTPLIEDHYVSEKVTFSHQRISLLFYYFQEGSALIMLWSGLFVIAAGLNAFQQDDVPFLVLLAWLKLAKGFAYLLLLLAYLFGIFHAANWFKVLMYFQFNLPSSTLKTAFVWFFVIALSGVGFLA